MTPIIDYLLANAEGLAREWEPELHGIPTFRSFLAAVADSAVYLVPEAETDTTAAVEMDPGYYDNNAGVRMPWHSAWIEFRAYAPPDDRYVGDSAYFLREVSDEKMIVCYGVTLFGGGQAFANPIPFFGWPTSELGNPNGGIGKPYKIRPSIYASPEQAAKACNFVRELLAFINAPSGVSDTVIHPDGPDLRKARRCLGPGAILPPYHLLRLDSAIISASSVAGRAAKAMGPAPSEVAH